MYEISGFCYRFLRDLEAAVFRLWPGACTCQVIGMLHEVSGVCRKQSMWPCHQTQKAEQLGN